MLTLTLGNYDIHYFGEDEDNTLFIWAELNNEEIDIFVNSRTWEVFLIENANGEEIELTTDQYQQINDFVSTIKDEVLNEIKIAAGEAKNKNLKKVIDCFNQSFAVEVSYIEEMNVSIQQDEGKILLDQTAKGDFLEKIIIIEKDTNQIVCVVKDSVDIGDFIANLFKGLVGIVEKTGDAKLLEKTKNYLERLNGGNKD